MARSLAGANLGLRPNPRALAAALLRVAGEHRRQFILHRLRGMLGELGAGFAGSGIERLRALLSVLEESYG